MKFINYKKTIWILSICDEVKSSMAIETIMKAATATTTAPITATTATITTTTTTTVTGTNSKETNTKE